MSANDKQVGGEHYKNPSGIEHWDLVIQLKLNYFEGQITKYVIRCRKKNGKQDLMKALHFLEKYLECYEQIAELPQQRAHVRQLPDHDVSNVRLKDDNEHVRGSVDDNDGSHPDRGYVNQ